MADLFDLGQSILKAQPFSAYIGAQLVSFAPGTAVLTLDIRPELLQHHGFVHGGVVSYLVDNALAFAGGSVLGENVVTAEYKVSFLRPAKGEQLIARAAVEASGARLATVRCDVVAMQGGKESRCAIGLGTIVALGPGP